MGMAGGRSNNVLFEREHKWLFGNEKYIDRTTYQKSQPLESRKKGFHSSDARRRDEFTQHFPSEQWRERLRTENRLGSKWTEQQMALKGAQIHEAPPVGTMNVEVDTQQFSEKKCRHSVGKAAGVDSRRVDVFSVK